MEHIKFLKGVCGKLARTTMTHSADLWYTICHIWQFIWKTYCVITVLFKVNAKQYLYSKEPCQDYSKTVFTILKMSLQYYFEKLQFLCI